MQLLVCSVAGSSVNRRQQRQPQAVELNAVCYGAIALLSYQTLPEACDHLSELYKRSAMSLINDMEA